MLARATVETWVIKAEKGEQDCCPKCDGKVFEAEKMVSASVSDFYYLMKSTYPLYKSYKNSIHSIKIIDID